jgi:hypothetical protein
MPNQPVPAAVTGLPSFTDIAVDPILDEDRSRTIGTSHFSFEPLWGEPLLAPAAPPPTEPSLEITEAGRTYLLLESIVSRLSIDGDVASFALPPSLAADIAAWQAKAPLEKDEDGEASDLLRLLIKRSDATVIGDGMVHLDLDLTNSEMDWLCSWNSESEDLEDDDPEEDSDPAESGHDNETDVWFVEDQTDEQAVQVQLARKLEPRERPAR